MSKQTQSSTPAPRGFSLKTMVATSSRKVVSEMALDYDPENNTTLPSRCVVAGGLELACAISSLHLGTAQFRSELVSHEGELEDASFAETFGFLQKVDETGSPAEDADGNPIISNELVRLHSFRLEKGRRKSHSPGTFAPRGELVYSLRADFGVPQVDIPNSRKSKSTDPDTVKAADLEVTSAIGNLVEGVIKSFREWGPCDEAKVVASVLATAREISYGDDTAEKADSKAKASDAETQVQNALNNIGD